MKTSTYAARNIYGAYVIGFAVCLNGRWHSIGITSSPAHLNITVPEPSTRLWQRWHLQYAACGT